MSGWKCGSFSNYIVLVYVARHIEFIFCFLSIWLMWGNGRCYNMFVFAGGFSFPEGKLSHLLSTDYLLSQNSLPGIYTRRNEDADIHGCTATHIHKRQDFSGPLLIPPLCVIVHGCVCFLGPQTQTVVGRGGGGGWRRDQRMERVGEGHTEMKLDAIITVCLWFNGCFCSWLDCSAYKSCITP